MKINRTSNVLSAIKKYFGGIDELKEFNQEVFDEVEGRIKSDAEAYISKELDRTHKRFK